MEKPSATKLLDGLTTSTKQYQDGLITEAEWCNTLITKLLTHHQSMMRFTADQVTQWNSAFRPDNEGSLGSFNHT